MDLYAIRRRSAWADAAELEKAAGISARIGNYEMPDKVRWIRSYVVSEPDGRLGTICIYEAEDVASIKEHARRVGMPGDEIDIIANTVVIRPDPQPSAWWKAEPSRARFDRPGSCSTVDSDLARLP
jgi:hypothetical protein